MKLLIFILFSLNVSAQTINGTGQRMTINGSGTRTTINATANILIAAINCQPVNIAGKYSGFPYPDCFLEGVYSGTIVTLYKESETHGAAGPIVIQRSGNGGATWTRIPVVVGGSPISAVAMSLAVYGSRIYISWNLSSATNVYYFAYSDDAGDSWVSAGSVTLALTGYISILFQKIKRLQSGKLLQCYYAVPADPVANPYINGFLQSTDNSVSWSVGPVIVSQFAKLVSETAGQALAAGRGVVAEPSVVITEVGASDATTKMVCYLRNEEYDGFTFCYSADGGATWTRQTGVVMTNFDPTSYRRPVSMINYNGTMYIFCGNRKAGDFGSEYITCTPAQLYANDKSNYSSVTRFHNGVADSYGSANDYGYTNAFEDEAGQLVAMGYDSDPGNTVGDNWQVIFQVVVVP